MKFLSHNDPEVYSAIKKEFNRQKTHLEMIASENFTSPAVMEAMGSVLTNKYAEGYPGKRYYGGCEYVDIVEDLAIERAKQIFGTDHANVQPHSGAQANMAAYLAFLNYKDTVMGLNLSHGGHLTHGSPVNASGLLYNFVSYEVDKHTETFDYDVIRKQAKKYKPKMIVTGATAYPRTIDFKMFREIADEVGAFLLADIAHIAGLVAADLHPSPIPHAHVVTTTTHKTLRGPRGGMILCSADYAKQVNKAIFPGSQGGPLMHVIAGKAVAFGEALKPDFKIYQQQVVKNAKALADELMSEGIKLISHGTDNHLMLLDVKTLGLTGKVAEAKLGEVGITANKNTIPFDTESPFVTSGIRLGTPALTTRRMKEPQMKEIAKIIAERLKKPEDAETEKKVVSKVKELADGFPLYKDIII